jgi:hypothetical protein
MKYVCQVEGQLMVEETVEVCENCGCEVGWNDSCGNCEEEDVWTSEDKQMLPSCEESYLHFFSIEEEGPQFHKYLDGNLSEAIESSTATVVMRQSRWFTEVTWHTNRELTDKEEDELLSYTSGQCSDGIGEGFEQRPCGSLDNGDELYYSMWKRNGKELISRKG